MLKYGNAHCFLRNQKGNTNPVVKLSKTNKICNLLPVLGYNLKYSCRLVCCDELTLTPMVSKKAQGFMTCIAVNSTFWTEASD